MPPKVAQEQIDAALALYLKYNGGNFPAIEREMRELGWSNFSRQRIRKADGNGGYSGWEVEYNWPRLLSLKEERTAAAPAADLDEALLTISLSILRNLQDKIALGDKDAGYQANSLLERINEIRARRPAEVDRYENFLVFLKDLTAASKDIAPELLKALHTAQEPLLNWADRKLNNGK